MRTRFKRRLRQTSNTALGHVAVGLIKALKGLDPDRMADRMGALMRRIGPLMPEHRIGRANLAAAFPEKPAEEIAAILGGAWENLGRLGAEVAHFDRLRERFAERVEFSERTSQLYGQLRDDGKPGLVFAAHLANWEIPALGAKLHGLESAVLYRAPSLGPVADFVRATRSSSMGTLVASGIDAPLRLARVLESGGHAGMLVDQHNSRGIETMFFGRPCKTHPLIALLARQFECPIHGARIIRLPGHRFRGEITEALVPPRDADGRIDVAGTMQAITDVVEGWVREHPEQWLWLHRRWR
jgi:KDO2-lipid IV(A) lauroyltransferase